MLRPKTALLSAAILALAACSGGDAGGGGGEEAAAPAAPANPSIPSLWAVDIRDSSGAKVDEIRVCDDGSLRAAFASGLPKPGGQPCMLQGEPAIGADALTAECKVADATYTAATDPQGELGRVFTMEMTLTPADGGEPLKHTAMYRRVGDCPADWAYGDMAAPNSPTLTNVFTGESKEGGPQR